MGDYILSCCSTADLSKERFTKREIQYTCFHFTLGDKEYLDDLGESVPPEDLYRRMVAGEETKTSQVSAAEYETLFEKNLKAGKDVLHVTLSTGISGTYNSACVARDILSERYPDRKIYVVDSLGASSGYGLIMETLADMRDAGMGIDELQQWIEAHNKELCEEQFRKQLGKCDVLSSCFRYAVLFCKGIIDFETQKDCKESVFIFIINGLRHIKAHCV